MLGSLFQCPHEGCIHDCQELTGTCIALRPRSVAHTDAPTAATVAIWRSAQVVLSSSNLEQIDQFLEATDVVYQHHVNTQILWQITFLCIAVFRNL